VISYNTGSGADLGFYKGRVSNSSESVTGGAQGDEGWDLCPLRRKFLYFLYQNGEFLWFLVIFIVDTVLFKNGHPNQKGGCLDALDPPPRMLSINLTESAVFPAENFLSRKKKFGYPDLSQKVSVW